MGEEVGYKRTADDTYAQAAMLLYQSLKLQVKAFNTDGVVSAQVWGTCPRCTHSMDVQLTLTAPVVSFRGGWSSIGRKNKIPPLIGVDCGCESPHDGRPAGLKGCGVSFSLPTAPPNS
jgi:hypothetical protein